MSDFDFPQESYEKIKTAIESDESPVGIDAQKAHVVIIQKLLEIEERLDRIEAQLET